MNKIKTDKNHVVLKQDKLINQENLELNSIDNSKTKHKLKSELELKSESEPELESNLELDVDFDKNFNSNLEQDESCIPEDQELKDLNITINKFSTTIPATKTPNALTVYLREIGRFPMLKPEEEYTLAQKVKHKGDSDAAFKLISSHLRLVVKIAMDFQKRWMQNVLDLIQEGNVGLIRATNKFDPDKGIKFSYYAAFWIKAYILKFIMDNWRMVKIGTTQNQRKLFYNLNKEKQSLIAQGFDPDSAMLAEKLGVSKEQVDEMSLRMDGSDVSLDITADDDNVSRINYLPALGPGTEETLASKELSQIVRQHLETILPTLSEKESDILQNRLLSEQPVTLREIGIKYNITRERVRQIETRLLQKIHIHLNKKLPDFSEDWIAP